MRRLGSIVLACAFVLVLAACASGGSESSSRPRTVSTSSAETSASSGGGSAAATSSAEPTGFPAIRFVPFVTGLDKPVFVTSAGDGTGRLYIVEKDGRVVTVTNGSVDATPFLDIASKTSKGSEQGLLGLAFAPDFANRKRFYVDYTDANGDTIIARYQVGDDGLAVASSEHVMMKIAQPFPNHNGGMIAFGKDGYLYVGMGDGGAGGDPFGNAQRKTRLLGKLLRMRVEASGTAPPSKALPVSSNPFYSLGGNARFVYDYGLRNPWRWSFDRKTNALYIGDVGQDRYEEIDYIRAGRSGVNCGWDRFEGRHTYPGGSVVHDYKGTLRPVAEYSHSQGEAVTGGYVYRGTLWPKMVGMYLYADYASGRVWGLRHLSKGWTAKRLLDSQGAISSFGQDDAGELYACDLNGRVLRIEAP